MLINDARKADVDTLLVHISLLNEGGIVFHKRYGFTECGRFKRIGRKRGNV